MAPQRTLPHGPRPHPLHPPGHQRERGAAGGPGPGAQAPREESPGPSWPTSGRPAGPRATRDTRWPATFLQGLPAPMPVLPTRAENTSSGSDVERAWRAPKRRRAAALLRPACSRLRGRRRLIGTAPGPLAFPSQKHAPCEALGPGETPGANQACKGRTTARGPAAGLPNQGRRSEGVRAGHQARLPGPRLGVGASTGPRGGVEVETPTGQVPLAPPYPAWPSPQSQALAGSARCFQLGQAPPAHLAPPSSYPHLQALPQGLPAALTLHMGTPLAQPPARSADTAGCQAVSENSCIRRRAPGPAAYALANPSPRPPRPGQPTSLPAAPGPGLLPD